MSRLRNVLPLLGGLIVYGILLSGCAPATPTAAPPEPTEAEAVEDAGEEPDTAEPSATESMAEGPQTGGTLVIGIKSEIVNVDGTKAGHTTLDGLLGHMVETLVTKDDQGNIVPLLATDWEVSEDGTTWTFELREGVSFHDGVPFNAEAVVLNFGRMLNPDFSLTRGLFYSNIEEVEVVDEYTVAFHTAEPWGPLLSYFSYPASGIISPSLADQRDLDHTYGTGPFMLDSWSPGEETVLTRNDQYWGEEPYLDSIIYREIPEDASRIALLETGEIDVALDAPSQLVQGLEGNEAYEVISMPSEQSLTLDVVVKREPVDDVRVRRAILRAIDIDAIIEGVMFGDAVPLSAFPGCTPQVTGCYEIPNYHQHDPEEAIQLLSDAGYPDGFSAKLLYPSPRYPRHTEILTAIQAQLSEVGIDLELESVEFGTFSEEYRKPLDETDFHMASWAWSSNIGDIAFGVNTRLPSGNAPPSCCNLMFYENDRVDELIKAADQSTDAEERAETLKELQEIVAEEQPLIYLLRYNVTVAQNADVRDIQYSAGQDHWFANAWKGQ